MNNPVERLRKLAQKRIKPLKTEEPVKVVSPSKPVKTKRIRVKPKTPQNKIFNEVKGFQGIKEEIKEKQEPIILLDEYEKKDTDNKLNISKPEEEKEFVKLIKDEHNIDFNKIDLPLTSSYKTPKPSFTESKKKELVYKVPCNCPIKDFYNCQKCNPIKQEERAEERKLLGQQIQMAQRKLKELEAIDGIETNPQTGEEVKKDTRTLLQKMMGYKQ